MFLLMSAQVSHDDETVQVEHLAGHFLHVPLVSKKPAKQVHKLLNPLKVAPSIQLEQRVGLASVQVAQSLA